MKETIRVSIGRLAYILEIDAYNELNIYLKALRKHFENNEDADEIISDIEYRLSELLLLRIGSEDTVITLNDINEVTSLMGTPKDFVVDEDTDNYSQTESESKQSEPKKRLRKRIYRSVDDKIIFGVCAGLAHRFDIDPVLVRGAYILLFLAAYAINGYLGLAFLLTYVVLTIIMPKAVTFEDKLQMIGADPSIYDIEDSKLSNSKVKRGSGLVEVITIILKIFLGIVGVGLLISAIGMIITFIIFLVYSKFWMIDDIFSIFNASLWGIALSTFLITILPIYALLVLIYKGIKGRAFKTQNAVLLCIGAILWIGSIAFLTNESYLLKQYSDPSITENSIILPDSVRSLHVVLPEDYKMAKKNPNISSVLYRENDNIREICLLPKVTVRTDSMATGFSIHIKDLNLEMGNEANENIEYILTDSILYIHPTWYNKNNNWNPKTSQIIIIQPINSQIESDKLLKVGKYDWRNKFINRSVRIKINHNKVNRIVR